MPAPTIIAAVGNSQIYWTTATNSVALVLGCIGFVAGGTLLAANRAAAELREELKANPNAVTLEPPRRRPRIKPLQAQGQQLSVQPPPKADSVDEVQQ